MRPLALLVVLACGAGHLPPGYLEPDTPNKHRIYGHAFYVSWHDWSNGPFFRIADDPHMPVYVLLDELGYGCLVPGEIWAMQPRLMACPSGWRAPRP